MTWKCSKGDRAFWISEYAWYIFWAQIFVNTNIAFKVFQKDKVFDAESYSQPW